MFYYVIFIGLLIFKILNIRRVLVASKFFIYFFSSYFDFSSSNSSFPSPKFICRPRYAYVFVHPYVYFVFNSYFPSYFFLNNCFYCFSGSKTYFFSFFFCSPIPNVKFIYFFNYFYFINFSNNKVYIFLF